MSKKYKINLAKQLSCLKASKRLPCRYSDGTEDKRPLYFNARIGRSKRIMGGFRDVIFLSFIEGTKGLYYKVNANGSIELPQSLLRRITHNAQGEAKFSMVTTIDDNDKKIIVPFMDSKGEF